MGLFGKTNERPPKEMVNEWCHKLRKEGYQLERQIKNIQREQGKTKDMLKASAKKGDKDSARVLAKSIVHADKAIKRIYASKAHLNSVQMNMKNQLANLRIAGALEKSSQVMTSMQQLVKVPEIQATMREMSKEMMKAGILEEMVEDTMDVMDDEELEEATDEEVQKIMFELTAGELGKAPAAVEDSLPAESLGATAGPSYAEDEDEEKDLTQMQARLEALRS